LILLYSNNFVTPRSEKNMKDFHISENDADQRLDKFLKKLFPNATRSLIYKCNRKDKVKVITLDGRKTKQDNEYRLQTGEVVQVFLSDKEIEGLRTPSLNPLSSQEKK